MTLSFDRTPFALVLVVPMILSIPASAQASTGGSWRGGNASDTPIRTTELPPSVAAPPAEIADRYLERARTDRENATLWVYCAAAVLKRGTANDAEADAYAREIAATLQSTSDRAATSPCEDAIPARVWGGDNTTVATDGESGTIATPDPATLTPAEDERLRRINAEADARERARVDVQAAAERRRTDAQARYDRERADYETQVAAARAADAQYQRQLAEHRRLLESGQYQAPQ